MLTNNYIRIIDTNKLIIDYFIKEKVFRFSTFKNGHFVNEYFLKLVR